MKGRSSTGMSGLLNKTILSDNNRKTRKVFAAACGSIALFLIVFNLVFNIIETLGGRAWAAVVSAFADEGYIGIQNLAEIITHPLILITGMVILAVYAFLLFWETSAIVLCIEYAYCGKPLKIFSIVPAAFQQMRHIFKPKNWLILIFTIVVLPFSGFFTANNKITNIILPEYWMEGILNKGWPVIGLVALEVGCFIWVGMWLFILPAFILERRDFKEARRYARALSRPHTIRHMIYTVVQKICSTICFETVPALILLLLYLIITSANAGTDGFKEAASYVISSGHGCAYLIKLCGCQFAMSYLLTYITVLYHARREAAAAQQRVEVKEIILSRQEKRSAGKSSTFKWVMGVEYAVLFLVAIVLMYMAGADSTGLINTDIEVAAHRGNTGNVPESTMMAFESACEAGNIDYIEFDVHPTADGNMVIMHDANAKRTTGVDADLSSLTLEEIKQLDAGIGYDSSLTGDKTQRVPTLEEVLDYCKDKYTDSGKHIKLIVEIKNHSHKEGFEAQIVEALEEYGYIDNDDDIDNDWFVIHSGSYESLCRVKECNPNIQCGLIMAAAVGSFVNMENVDFFSMEHSFITDDVIYEAHAANKRIFAWTVDEETNINDMIELGVDCIIGDFPLLTRELINSSELDVAGVLTPLGLSWCNSAFAYGTFDFTDINTMDTSSGD